MIHLLKVLLIILGVLAIFNLMIIVHELGHFLAARWRGLVVEKFGIWFGKPIWKKTINGVQYSLGSIPAGGFVALPQLAPMEVMEGKVETPREMLPPISVLDKIIVAFAGPLFSFLLAVVFAVIIWDKGRPLSEAESTQVVGVVHEKYPAAAAGIQEGDKIISVDGHKVSRYSGMSADSIQWSIVRSEGDKIEVVVERQVNGVTETKPIWVSPRVPEKPHWWNRAGTRVIGIDPATSALVAEVEPNSPAARDGLKKGDVVEAINGQKIYGPNSIYEYGRSHEAESYQFTVDRAGQKLTIPYTPVGIRVADDVQKDTPAGAAGLRKGDVILGMDDQKAKLLTQFIDYVGSRNGVAITLRVRRGPPPRGFFGRLLESLLGPSKDTQPEKIEDLTVTPKLLVTTDPNAEKKAKIGFVPEQADGIVFDLMGKTKLIYPSPGEQLHMSAMAIVNTLDAVFSRKSSVGVQHMGGPVMMMNVYYHMLSSPEGLRMAIWFSVVLNVNLALLNMLPIPVLDGGHITLAIIEGVRRKPMNVRILEYVQTTCALVIIGFMVFIMFFDVQDLPFVGGGRSSMHFQNSGESPK